MLAQIDECRAFYLFNNSPIQRKFQENQNIDQEFSMCQIYEYYCSILATKIVIISYKNTLMIKLVAF
jgi:hypothetical protein